MGRLTEDKCKDARVIVAGSAPCLNVEDALLTPCDLQIAANGAAALIPTDVLCTTSYLFRENCSPAELSTVETLSDRYFEKIWLDVKSAPGDKAIRAMMQMGIKWHKLIYVYDDDRQEVTNAACGKRLWVSTGVWGVCLALTSDAKSVHAVGISLGPGHVATGDQLPRDHVNEDKECLRLLTERFADRLIIDPALRSQL